jgi:hypothetical protein
MPEVIEIPAEDHTAEVEKLDTAIADWEARAIAGDAAESVMRILDELHAKHRVLIDAGVRTEARREVRYTDELMTDRWRSLETDHERGAFLRSMGSGSWPGRPARAGRASGYSRAIGTGQTSLAKRRTPAPGSPEADQR